jgi:hypothetical protein
VTAAILRVELEDGRILTLEADHPADVTLTAGPAADAVPASDYWEAAEDQQRILPHSVRVEILRDARTRLSVTATPREGKPRHARP